MEFVHSAIGPSNGEIELNLPREIRGRKRPIASKMASLGVHTDASIMARLAGMRLEARWADWHGSRYVSTSTEHVSVYRLPG